VTDSSVGEGNGITPGRGSCKLARHQSFNTTGTGVSLKILSRTEFGGTEVKIIDRIPSVPENCTTSERNILSDDRKKTPVTSQGHREESDLLNDLGFNLCVAPRSLVMRLVAYFGVREVAKTEVLRNQVKESEWTRRD